MSDATGLITVRLGPTRPEYEAEFNDWYDLEHVPQLTALPGFVRTRRYVCEKSDIRYLAWYETVNDTIEAGPDFQRIVKNPTPWSVRIRKLYENNRERMNFKLMRDVANATATLPADGAPWMYIVHTDIPGHIIGEYNAWYDKEHLPRCANIPGVLRARRYTAVSCTAGNIGPQYLTTYELTGPDVWESPAAQLARKTPWTEKMRSLFSNTRRALYQMIAPNVEHDQALKMPRVEVK